MGGIVDFRRILEAEPGVIEQKGLTAALSQLRTKLVPINASHLDSLIQAGK
jgi:hypothetical protein